MAAKNNYHNFVKKMMKNPKVKSISDHKDRMKYVAYHWHSKDKKKSKDKYEYVNIGDSRPLIKQLEHLSNNFDSAIDGAAKGLGIHRTKFGVIAEAKLMSDLIINDLHKINDFLLTDVFEHDKLNMGIKNFPTNGTVSSITKKISSFTKLLACATSFSRSKI